MRYVVRIYKAGRLRGHYRVTAANRDAARAIVRAMPIPDHDRIRVFADSGPVLIGTRRCSRMMREILS